MDEEVDNHHRSVNHEFWRIYFVRAAAAQWADVG